MNRIALFLILISITFSVIAEDLRTSQEYSPEEIDFDEARIIVRKDGKKLNAKSGLKISGIERDVEFFNGNLKNIPPEMPLSVRDQISRILDEARIEIEQYKTERKKVLVTFARVKILTPPDLDDSNLRLEARDFLRTFNSGTTELGQMYDRLMRSKFKTGPRLSKSQQTTYEQKLKQAMNDLLKQGIDLQSYVNCTDDRDVCEDIFLEKYIQDNNEGKKQAREVLIRLSKIHGSDLIAVGDQPFQSSGAVLDYTIQKNKPLQFDKIVP